MSRTSPGQFGVWGNTNLDLEGGIRLGVRKGEGWNSRKGSGLNRQEVRVEGSWNGKLGCGGHPCAQSSGRGLPGSRDRLRTGTCAGRGAASAWAPGALAAPRGSSWGPPRMAGTCRAAVAPAPRPWTCRAVRLGWAWNPATLHRASRSSYQAGGASTLHPLPPGVCRIVFCWTRQSPGLWSRWPPVHTLQSRLPSSRPAKPSEHCWIPPSTVEFQESLGMSPLPSLPLLMNSLCG